MSMIDQNQQSQIEDAAQEQLKDVPVSSASWLAEIDAALKREKSWRKDAKAALNRYRGEAAEASNDDDSRRGGFNILWSNTETLRNATYNQAPRPDVRQRWQTKDPLALACAQVLDRSLEYVLDVGNFHQAALAAVLDFFLPGRAVLRVRYEPDFAQEALPDGNFVETVAAENIVFEPVSYRDFVHADAPSWNRVEWCAFRHHMTKAEIKAFFPDVDADDLRYVEGSRESSRDGRGYADDSVRSGEDGEYTDKDARAEVWEIWDRRGKVVLWVSKGLPSALKYEEPPLKLEGFFPCACPAYAVPSPDSLLPTTLYSQYEDQALELDNLTRRIEATGKIIRWRGAYAGSLGTEVGRVLTDATDGELVPIDNETAIMERGGINGAIWLFDTKQAADVLQKLYEQREATKQTIYEITGISDILRGVTRASETATAQQIKAAWGSSRVDGYKREIQRLLAATLRLAAEIICETYQVQTLAAITGLQYPTAADQQAAQMQMQQIMMQGQQAEQAAQMGDPAAQQAVEQLKEQRDQLQKVLDAPSWDAIQGVLQSDLQRSYKVEIETDSTIAPNQQQDLKDLSDTMQAIGGFGQVFLPGVQSGIVPPELFMEVLRAIIQRTPLSNLLTDKFSEYLDGGGMVNPLQRQVDELRGQLEQAQNERGLKEKALELQGAEIQSREKIEGAKLQLEAQKLQLEGADMQQRAQLEAMKARDNFEQQIAARAAMGG